MVTVSTEEVSSVSTTHLASPLNYSTLEVDPSQVQHGNVRYLEHDRGAGPFVRYEGNEKVLRYKAPPPVYVNAVELDTSHASSHLEQRTCGLKKKQFYVLMGVAALLVAGLVGGIIGGVLKSRPKSSATSPDPSPPKSTPSRGLYQNLGLGAMQYMDLEGVIYKNVYYQDSGGRIRESSWDNSTVDRSWTVNVISGAMKSGTPIGAAAGFAHANITQPLVKNVYYLSSNQIMIENQAPANDSQAWLNDNLSGLYTGSNLTHLSVYWNQNFQNASQELVVLFQSSDFENGITQARYTSNATTSNPWVANNFGFSHSRGSAFTLAPLSYRQAEHVALYRVDDSNQLRQHEYMVSGAEMDPKAVIPLIAEESTGIPIEPRSPLTVAVQNNLGLYTLDEIPECTRETPLTHLIFYPSADHASLHLNVWNCTSGYVDQTEQIAALQRPDTVYMSLAVINDKLTGESSLFVMFDSGRGPQIEEWKVPRQTGEV